MPEELRLRFFTDLHGSTLCWRKAMGSALDARLKPDVIVIGGDISGKYVVPIVKHDPTTCSLRFEGVTREFDVDQLPHVEEEIEDRGAYTCVLSIEEAQDFFASKPTRRSLEENLQKARLTKWLSLVDKYLKDKGVRIILNCGNDDPLWMDDIIKKHPAVSFAEGSANELNAGVSLVSVGYSPPTPFNTIREEPEYPNLYHRMENAIRQAPDTTKAIFNFHCPPKDSALDAAPAVDSQLRPIPGATVSAGSVVVRRAIENHKPLLGLHGHIHERSARDTIGGTPCFNPGSQYWTGTLPGVFAVVRNARLVLAELTTDTLPLGKSSGFPLSALVQAVAGSRVGRAWDEVLQSAKSERQNE